MGRVNPAGSGVVRTSLFDNTLITKLSGSTVLVYDKPNPSQGETAVNGGIVTRIGNLLAYQFHVVFDEDDEFVLQLDSSLVPNEVVTISCVCDDASPGSAGFRSPGPRQIRFNRDDTINADVDAHIIVWAR